MELLDSIWANEEGFALNLYKGGQGDIQFVICKPSETTVGVRWAVTLTRWRVARLVQHLLKFLEDTRPPEMNKP